MDGAGASPARTAARTAKVVPHTRVAPGDESLGLGRPYSGFVPAA